MLNLIKRKTKEFKERQEAFKEKQAEEQKMLLRQEELFKYQINLEINNYLETILPTFIISTHIKDALLKMLKARYNGGELSIYMTDEETEMFMTYYNNDLNVFLKVLESKGISVQNREELFVNIFVQNVIEANYKNKLNKYGNFVGDEINLEKALFQYFEILGIDSILNVDNVSFLTTLLYKNTIIDIPYPVERMGRIIDDTYQVYKINCQMRKMQSRLYNNEVSNRLTIEYIDELDGVEFEKFLKDLFERLKYRVEETKTTGDQGVDLIIYKNNECTVIQAKRYNNTVGNSAIQQAVAGQRHYSADKSMVVTNNYFTKSAIELAQSNNTTLWDRDKLKEIIEWLY